MRNRIGATTGGIACGGALYLGAEAALVANNTFVANMCSTAIPTGAAIFSANPRVTIKNNILVDNVATGIAPSGGGIACYPDSLDTLVCDNNDVWRNTPEDYYGCRPGPRALSLDPLFVPGPGGNYYLSHVAAGQDSTSPCVDAGDTLALTTPLNLDSLIHTWTTRTDTVPDAGAIDIGYHYEPHPLTGVAAALVTAPDEVRLPGIVSGVLYLPQDGGGRLRAAGWLLDVGGRKVLTLRPGANDLHGIAAGIYFVRMGDGRNGVSRSLTRKLVIAR